MTLRTGAADSKRPLRRQNCLTHDPFPSKMPEKLPESGSSAIQSTTDPCIYFVLARALLNSVTTWLRVANAHAAEIVCRGRHAVVGINFHTLEDAWSLDRIPTEPFRIAPAVREARPGIADAL